MRCFISEVPQYRCGCGFGISGLGGRVQGLAHLRLIDSCITQHKAQGPFKTCNESKEEEEFSGGTLDAPGRAKCETLSSSLLLSSLELSYTKVYGP